MKHTHVKLVGLLVALTLALTGCNLIGIDQMKQLDLDFAALEKDFSTVVASYDGGEITKGEALHPYASMVSYYSQLYSMFGMSINDQVLESVKQQTLQNMVQNVAIAKEFDARGLTLSDEKLAEIQENADKTYQDSYDAVYAKAAGKGDVKARQAEYDLYANGYSKEGIYNELLAQAKREALEESLNAEIPEVTDEQLQKAYDDKVAEDKESYAEDHDAYESAMTEADELVTWNPEGYRTVKHILVKADDSVMTAVKDTHAEMKTLKDNLKDLEEELKDLNDAGTADETADAAEGETTETRTAEQIQADIDAAKAEIAAKQADVDAADAAVLENVKAKTDEIYAKLAEGATFADLIAEYGEDPGMQNEPTSERGYYVCADSEHWDYCFTEGAMALANVGDVSQTPVVGTSGAHIIRYESDVTPGAVPLDEIRETLTKTTLENLQEEHITQTLDALTSALNPKYNADAFVIG